MSEGTWEKLSQVAVKGAEHDSRERQPHPKCLEGTRVVLLNHIYELLDKKEKNRLIWLHGTAGVGKSAVAFTVAERMKGLKMTEETKIETRLAGTFFFSRKHTKRRTTGYFFATLAYQLAINFPSIRKDVNRAILDNPALLDPDKSLRDQMEALFLQPLRKLQIRLRECPPLAFIVDALDECTPESIDQSTSEFSDEDTSESELADLIALLAQALRDPGLPVTHILVTSRSEAHIHEAMDNEDVWPLVCEIPVKIFGQGVAATISLDGADVDEDIYLFLEHSFRKLRSRYPAIPQPTKGQLERLASRAGRRFIVASTMMKFIDDRYNDPRDRLQLMLELSSELLPGTEVYKLYDRILSTCADPSLAYLHLSVVCALADPLPISQISTLLGPSQGNDVERVLVQLRSVIEIPTDISLPVNIYHSSVRDYVSQRSNCTLRQVQYIASPHSLLAASSLRLMIQDIPDRPGLLDALSALNKHSQAMEPRDPQSLTRSLSFTVQPPEPMQVLITLLWLRGNRSPELQFWLETLDGRAWLATCGGNDWLQTQGGRDWLRTYNGRDWLQTQYGKGWLQTRGGKDWLQTQYGKGWLQTQDGKDWLQTQYGNGWLQTQGGKDWLQTQYGKDWLQTQYGKDWLQTYRGIFLQTQDGRDWLQTQYGKGWLQTQDGKDWLQTRNGKGWLQTRYGKDWLQTQYGKDWLQTYRGIWLQTQDGRDWLQSLDGRYWLQTQDGKDWLQEQSEEEQSEEEQSEGIWARVQTHYERPQSEEEQSEGIWDRVQTHYDWPQRFDLPPPQSIGGAGWLQTSDRLDWLETPGGRRWLQTLGGREWLQFRGGSGWLQSPGGRDWSRSADGQEWLQTEGGRSWLQTSGRAWLQTSGRGWLQTKGGRDWLQTSHGQAWRLTTVWVTMEEFLNTLEAIREYTISPGLPLPPAFQAIQQFKTLPDFLMFPAFLALRHQDRSTSALPQSRSPHMEVIRAMDALSSFSYEAHAQSRTASDALKYAHQNWAVHLSRAPNPWDERLFHVFKSFWNHHLLFWLERQWCLKDLPSCLTILSDGQKLATEHLIHAPMALDLFNYSYTQYAHIHKGFT